VAAGLPSDEALSQASQIADALIDNGDSLRIARLEKRLAKVDPEFEREQTRAKIKRNLADARSGKYKRNQSTAEVVDPKLDSLLGSFPRFLLGCLLVIGSVMWAQQNDLLLSAEQFQELGKQGMDAVHDQASGPSGLDRFGNHWRLADVDFCIASGIGRDVWICLWHSRSTAGRHSEFQ